MSVQEYEVTLHITFPMKVTVVADPDDDCIESLAIDQAMASTNVSPDDEIEVTDVHHLGAAYPDPDYAYDRWKEAQLEGEFI